MTATMSNDEPQVRQVARRSAAWLLWFGVLGGALAWTAHLFLAWGLDEVTCSAPVPITQVLGLPVKAWIALAVVVPAAVTALAGLAAYRSWRAARGGPDEPSVERAAMMGLVGTWADLLFFVIIVFGGIAVLTFGTCE